MSGIPPAPPPPMAPICFIRASMSMPPIPPGPPIPSIPGIPPIPSIPGIPPIPPIPGGIPPPPMPIPPARLDMSNPPCSSSSSSSTYRSQSILTWFFSKALSFNSRGQNSSSSLSFFKICIWTDRGRTLYVEPSASTGLKNSILTVYGLSPFAFPSNFNSVSVNTIFSSFTSVVYFVWLVRPFVVVVVCVCVAFRVCVRVCVLSCTRRFW
mmetsp:Transcript_61560/g.150690  ORF Transcript_61560/g.150690 Transcript_61560/m.150690 type:complete len:210 (+) Transcript_61560:335-964(+)